MGLMYGMAVYTTFRLPLAEYWIAQHVERLMDNAQHLGLPVSYTATEFQQALIPHFQMERPIFRLTLVADVAEYSDFYQKPAKPARLLLAMREAPGEASMPVSLKSVDYVRTMPLVKHLGMADVIQLKKQARLQGFQEILLAGGGQVREASTANILFIRKYPFPCTLLANNLRRISNCKIRRENVIYFPPLNWHRDICICSRSQRINRSYCFSSCILVVIKEHFAASF